MRTRIIHLVNPKTDSLTTRPLYMNWALYSPLAGLLAVAAAVPRDRYEVVLTDENIEAIDFDLKADLVGISAMTSYVNRGYQIADAFRARGVPVVMGGVHPSFMPQELLKHCDAVVIGEVELVIDKLLDDLECGEMRGTYKSDMLHSMGFDGDDLSVFGETARFNRESDYDACAYSVLTPSIRPPAPSTWRRRRSKTSWPAVRRRSRGASCSSGAPPTPGDLRKFIEATPVLDFNSLEPGKKGTDAIRSAVAGLDLASHYQARERLTGPVPIENEEFATVREGAVTNGVVTLAVVLLILWMALKSFRIIMAVVIALFIGLSITAALGLMMVGALNLISVAFAVLFVGLGVDFGIQFSVRYRQERFKEPDLRKALMEAAARAGVPLTLAATAVAAGFLSFMPTDYRGVSELGQIAGVGMLIAYVTSITVLPALLYVLHPPREQEALGIAALAPVDDFLERHRIAIIVATLGVAIAGLPLLYFLRFDFNPMNLRSATVELVATYLDLRRDPATGANSINVLVPSVQAADEAARRFKALPRVGTVRTIDTFVPDDQPAKLALIAEAAKALDPVLALPARAAPTDEEIVAALNLRAGDLTRASENGSGPGAGASKRLAAAMTKLAMADPARRQRVEAAFTVPLKLDLDDMRDLLKAMPITLDNLPEEITRSWRATDGRIRVEVVPSGDPDDNENIRAFARAVLALEPTATGGPISILESGRTVVTAFLQAGGWALASISILLWITLRRFGDVLLTLIPLVLAGVVTLEICVLIRMPLNFANIIALPLLLGIGVAFKIYFVMAWRSGRTKLLQSSLTRAVIFSAMTTATAFGSLWFSSHPGTSSMGKLLTLSLACTLAAAVLFQPALMGKPRTVSDV